MALGILEKAGGRLVSVESLCLTSLNGLNAASRQGCSWCSRWCHSLAQSQSARWTTQSLRPCRQIVTPPLRMIPTVFYSGLDRAKFANRILEAKRGLKSHEPPPLQASFVQSHLGTYLSARVNALQTSAVDNHVEIADELSRSNDMLVYPPLKEKGGALPPLQSGTLYLVGTPIGNLEDMTFRALRVLQSADLILAEDTRHSGKLLSYFGIKTPMISFHLHNEQSREAEVLQKLRAGKVVAVISDAGMPGISDPGMELVEACVGSQIPVVPVPGPSAVITALVASGLPTYEFTFVGFLPPDKSARRKRLTSMKESKPTQIMFVGPHKLAACLADAAETIGADRRCVVARSALISRLVDRKGRLQDCDFSTGLRYHDRAEGQIRGERALSQEMTKMFEEFYRGTLGDAAAAFRSPDAGEGASVKRRRPEQIVRGEVTLLIEGFQKQDEEDISDDAIMGRLLELKAGGASVSDATREIVEASGLRKKKIYRLALDLWNNG